MALLSAERYAALKRELKENLTLSVPLTASQLIFSCSGFIGTAFIARLGEDALAASVLVSSVWFSLTTCFFGLFNSVSVLVAHQYGAKNKEKISEIMGQAFILGIIVAIPLITVIAFMPKLFQFTSQPQSVLTIASDYMHALIFTTPGLIVLVIIDQFLAGINRAKLVLRISIAIVPIEIVLIYLLIFGKFGLPAFGVAGIGYGFTATFTLTSIFLLFYLNRSPTYRSYELYKHLFDLKIHILKELIRIGLPMGMMGMIEVSTFAVMSFWMAEFGTATLAAHQIALQYFGFFITFAFSMSQTVTVRVGHEVGKKNLQGISDAFYVALALSSAILLFVTFLYILFPKFFLSIDIDILKSSNSSLVEKSTQLLILSGWLILFDNVRDVTFGALRGLKDTKFPMFCSFLSFWVIGLTCAYLGGFYLNYHGKGIWLGICVGIAVGATLLLWRLAFRLQALDLETLSRIRSLP